MMTHRQRILTAVSGQMPDILPYAPRIDLWYRANTQAGTLPLHHQGRTAEEISRAEGWTLHKVVPDYRGHPDAPLHRGIGAYCLKEQVFRFTFSPNIDIRIKRDNVRTLVEYRTPIGTVRGDMHDIGKNMVAAMLRGVGFKVVDLGVNVPTEQFVKQVADHQPDILGMSALLATTMWEMRNVIQSLKEAGLRERVKIVVGGAPVNERFAKEIEADDYGQDAGQAVALAKGLMRAR